MLTYELKYIKGIMYHARVRDVKIIAIVTNMIFIWKVIKIYVACFVLSFYSLNLLDIKTN